MSIRITFEMSAFVGLVAVGHLMLVAPKLEEGLQSAGAGGADLLSAMASTAAVAAMVQSWEATPSVAPSLDVPKIVPTSRVATPKMDPPQNTPVSPAPVVALPSTSPNAPSLPSMPKPLASPEAPPVPPTPQKQAEPADPLPSVKKPVPKDAPPQTRPKSNAKQTAKQSSSPTKSQSARKAVGTGGAEAKGNSGSEKTASLSNSKRTSLLKKWSAQIRARLAHKAPKGVGKGTVIVRLKVSADGQVLSAHLVKSSGTAKVDTMALNAVKRVGRLPKAPAKLQLTSQQFDIPITSR